MNIRWFAPTEDEIEAVALHLVSRHGADAPEEALRLAEAYRSIGASKNARLYRLAARKCAVSLAHGARTANGRSFRAGHLRLVAPPAADD